MGIYAFRGDVEICSQLRPGISGHGRAVSPRLGRFRALRNQAALDYECFRMLAQAAKCSLGDQMHPRGRLEKAVYDRIGSTYKKVEEKEPWCIGAQAVTEIGFLSTRKPTTQEPVATSDAGATNMLAELHQQFDVLDRDSDFSRYSVLILPDSHRFDQDLLRQVRSYLAGGGKLILSHESGLDLDGKQFVLSEMGVEYFGPSPYPGDLGDYFEALEGVNDADPMVQFTYARGLRAARPSRALLS